ncbi:DnaJ family domain-containing protein [Bacillus sp. T3]|uniref:DnaJ family domain-containing protein n=1 Tax=Bacillus sp. T3 TaxID=467262 RepID=UPI002980E719|nr:DnaJ family domain-containing protein [Bacillus sp. T3]
MDIFSIIAEDKIKRAMKDGEFDNLPGKGKPLELEDLSHLPQELRIAYTLLKNANMLEDLDRLKEEMLTIDDLISVCDSSEERANLRAKKQQKQLRIEELLKKRGTLHSPPSTYYKEKMFDKFKRK